MFAIAKNSAALAAKQAPSKDCDDSGFSVWILTRPVDVRKGQRHVVQAVKKPKGVEVVVNNLLGHAVGRNGMLRMLLVNRKIFRQRIAVDRSAA